MKFKTRKKLLRDYDHDHPVRNCTRISALKRYFSSRNLNFEKALKKAQARYDKIDKERSFKVIRIVMYEYPMKTDRPRTFGGRTFSPNAKENHDYFEKAVRSVMKCMKLINTPAEIYMKAYLEMPPQVPPHEVILFEAEVLHPVTTPDFDNIAKCYADIQKMVLITDDDVFYMGALEKFYSVIPRVELEIRFQSKHDSEYVYKKIKSRKSIKELIQNDQCEIEKI